MNSEVKTASKYIENLNWRYATKKFDKNKEVSEESLQKMLDSVQLSASSYGLQPYEIIVVKDAEIREKLKAAAWNQPQLTEASYVFVFANFRKIDETYIDSYLDNIAQTRNISREKLKGMEDMLKNTILSYSEEEQRIWGAKQAYLALGNFLSAAAEYRIDACPMEGFDAEQFDEILSLESKNLTAAAIATLGYRSEEDQLQYQEKVRKNKTDLYHII